MLPFGVVTASAYRQTPADASRLVRAILNRRRVALRLLRTDLPPTPSQLVLFEEVMRRLRLRSGIYRTTYRRRFAKLDPFVNDVLRSHFLENVPLRVEDWAASDCLTSVEWAESLFRLFPRAKLTASDLTLYLVQVSLPDGSEYVVDGDGNPLQYVKGPFVVSIYPPEPKLALIGRLMARSAETRFNAISATFPDGLLDSGEESKGVGNLVLRKIPLVHPEAMMMTLNEPRFMIVRRSAFVPSDQRVHVVRTMNIMNRGYFGIEALRAGIHAVWASLERGGIWIVGRTVEGQVSETNASLCERTECGFRVVARFGSGSEIEDIATGSHLSEG